MKKDQKLLLLIAAASVAVWFVPALNWLVMPLTYLNTHLHEFCHAVAAELTGGQAMHILVHADGSGVTPSRGGVLIAIASAGYVGTAVLGGLFVLVASTAKRARHLMLGLAVTLGFSVLLFVRGDLVGLASGVLWAATFAILWFRGQPTALRWVGQFIGVQLCLTSLQSFSVLIRASTVSGINSDASIMQDATGVPAVFWAVLWAGIALAVVVTTLYGAWHAKPSQDA